MKKAALIAAALAMVLSLAACGNRDNNTPGNQTNGTTENGTNYNGTTNNGTGTANNGTNNNGTVNGTTNGTTGSNGSISGNTGTDAGLGANGTGSNAGTGTSTGTGTGTGTTRSSVGNDLRRAADDVGDAVRGMVDDGRSAVTRNTNTTSFQRMLNNARVHDVDGVLTDGENSRW